MKILPPLTDEDKMLSGLSYPLWPIAPAFILCSSKKEDPFLYYHALQGLAFGAVSSLAAGGVGLLVVLLFRIIPGNSTTLSGVLGVAVFIGGMLGLCSIFVVSLFLGWRASAGDMLKLPGVGEWAETRMLAATGLSLEDLGPEPEAEPQPEPTHDPQQAPTPGRTDPAARARTARPSSFGSPSYPKQQESRAAGPLGAENNLLKQWLASVEDD